MSRDFGNDSRDFGRDGRRAGGYAKGPRNNGGDRGRGGKPFGERRGGKYDDRRDGKPYGERDRKPYGKDRDGVTSHLLSVAHMDPTGIMCGNSIMNLSVDENTVQNEESFEKLVSMIEIYFREGGLHVQLNHVSAEELIAAKKDPVVALRSE